MKSLSVWYRSFGVYIVLAVFALVICLIGRFGTAVWSNDWPMWFAIPTGMINACGAIWLTWLAMVEGVTPAWKFPATLVYYLAVLIGLGFVFGLF